MLLDLRVCWYITHDDKTSSYISRDAHARQPLDFTSVRSLHVQLRMQIGTFSLVNYTIRAI